MVRADYECWAELLSYPMERRAGEIGGLVETLSASDPGLAEELRSLANYVDEHGPAQIEELFVRTFENNAERALELGWHLYGENYARGSFMARMRGLLREHGIAEGVELPDHASHVLRLMAHSRDELTTAMADQVVAPALERIAKGFAEQDNPYARVISALRGYVAREVARGQAGAKP